MQFKGVFRGFLVAAMMVVLPAMAQAGNERIFTRSLIELMLQPTSRIALQTHPLGQRLAREVLGHPIYTDADFAYLAERVAGKSPALDEKLYRRLREIESRAYSADGKIAIDSLEWQISERFRLVYRKVPGSQSWNEELDFVSVHERTQNLTTRSEAFMKRELWRQLPSGIAALRVRKAYDQMWWVRHAFYLTSEVRSLEMDFKLFI
jgi:hypothetical protein